MIETWVLILGLASGEVMIKPTLGELACDTERRAVIAAAGAVCIEEGSQFPIAAQCVPAAEIHMGEDVE